MQTFTKMIDKFLEYLTNNKDSMVNMGKKKWVNEFEIETERGDVSSEYLGEINSQKRGAVKEREDSKAVFERMLNIRKKNRLNYYVDEYVRYECIEYSMERKKQNIQDFFNEELI